MSRSPFTASLLVVAVAVAACTPKADLVIQGGSVWTGLSTGRGVPGTVAIANGKILAVGDSAEVARYVGAQTRVLRAEGGLVVPGLADGHTHFIDGGFQLASVDLRDAATPEEFIRRFLLHVLPTGLTRIRHYGVVGNRCRTSKLAACRRLFAQPAPPVLSGNPLRP